MPKYGAFLCKYAEIGLKGRNRWRFEEALSDQIKLHLEKHGEFRVVREDGRIFITCPSEYDYDDVVNELKKVFGIWAIMPVKVVPTTDYGTIKKQVVEYVDETYENKKFTFKIFAKRSEKTYPHPSPEICADMGEAVLENFPETKVDVHNPEESITVEVRRQTYIYSVVIRGAGGMPLGTGGKAMLLLSGGIDSPVAGYMISKRGVTIDAVYFHAPPYTSERAKQKVIDLAKIISEYTGPVRLHIVNFTPIELYIDEKCPHDEITIIMRRFMMRIACIIAEKEKCLGLVTGESIGQVASQTLQSLYCTNEVCNMPVYRPLIAYDKQDIVEMAQNIGTFATSIQPFEDCCTIFVAKHPVTKPIIHIIKESEELLTEADRMVDEAVSTAELTVCQKDAE